MGLRRESSLACSINIRDGARGRLTLYTPPRETLAATSSRLNSEALAARVVLAYSHMAFHPCTCGLFRDAATVAAVLVSSDDMKVATRMTTRMRQS
jgi:hypothetical protein